MKTVELRTMQAERARKQAQAARAADSKMLACMLAAVAGSLALAALCGNRMLQPQVALALYVPLALWGGAHLAAWAVYRVGGLLHG